MAFGSDFYVICPCCSQKKHIERKVESHSAEGELKQNGVTITPLKQNGVTITPLKQNGVTITPSIYPDEYIKNFFSAHRINVDESETNLYFSQDGKKYKLDIKKLLLLGLLEEVK